MMAVTCYLYREYWNDRSPIPHCASTVMWPLGVIGQYSAKDGFDNEFILWMDVLSGVLAAQQDFLRYTLLQCVLAFGYH